MTDFLARVNWGRLDEKTRYFVARRSKRGEREAVRAMVELTMVSDGVPRPLHQVPKREASLLGCSQYVCCGISAWL